MEPRLPTSKRKQDFPLDYIKMIQEVIRKNFKKASKDNKVLVRGHIYPEEICLQIGFQAATGIKQVNFEASVDHSVKEKNILDQIYLALDSLGSLIGQYFDAEGDIEVPKDWYEFNIEGKLVYLRVTGSNPDLEEKANEILNKKNNED